MDQKQKNNRLSNLKRKIYDSLLITHYELLWPANDLISCWNAWPAPLVHQRTSRDDSSVPGSWVKQLMIRFRRPRRRQRSSNTSTKKTYDNLDDLIADITAGRVKEIDFSTFRNIHESSHFLGHLEIEELSLAPVLMNKKDMFLIRTCQKS